MQFSTVLDRIDTGAMALPEFQRGYVWSRKQVRELVESLYRDFPVGSLLLWETATENATARGDSELQRGVVSLILDGQQRVTSMYGLVRGTPPPFFDGDARAFRDLRFHVETEQFAFYAPVTMRNDPLWIDVTDLMLRDPAAVLEDLQDVLSVDGAVDFGRMQRYNRRLTKLQQIREKRVHPETITGADKTLEVVVELFNRVNSGGTQLSKGDLALAKICAMWPEARDELKARLARWEGHGYSFSLNWLLRNITAVLTARAEFDALEHVDVEAFRDGLERTERAIDVVLNMIAGRLGLDHARVLGAVGALPVLVRYVADRGGRLEDQDEADRLLYWYVNALMWGRYASSTETTLNLDLSRIVPEAKPEEGATREQRPQLEALIAEIRRSRGTLQVRPDDFVDWSRGARFYPVLYLLTRTLGARDLGSGLELRQALLGRHAALEVHHLFPKAALQRAGYAKSERNALANFAFLTLETNRSLGDRPPAEYLADCERRHPGVLSSQWIPDDPYLWSMERYTDFLEARRELLAAAANLLLDELAGGQLPVAPPGPTDSAIELVAEDEETELDAVQSWLREQGLAVGERDWLLYRLDAQAQDARLDLAWPDGIRFDGEKVALLLDEPDEIRDAAARHGFRCFASTEELRRHVADTQELAAA